MRHMEPVTSGTEAAPARLLHAAPQRPTYSLLRRQGPWRDALRRRMLALADVLAFVAATAVAVAANGSGGALVAPPPPHLDRPGQGPGVFDPDPRRGPPPPGGRSGRRVFW